jgi:hypothetical protein
MARMTSSTLQAALLLPFLFVIPQRSGGICCCFAFAPSHLMTSALGISRPK